MQNRARNRFWLASRALAWGLMLVLLAWAAPAHAELYRYVDEAGTVHYVESINKVPEQYRDQIKSIRGDKVPTYQGRTPSRGRNGPSPVPAGPSTRSALGDAEGRTQAYWCGERERISTELAEVTKRLDTLKSRGPVNTDQAAGLKALYEIQKEMERLTERQVELQSELDELPNTVRKAGGNPGWVKGVRCPTEGPKTIKEAGTGPTDEEIKTREYWEGLKKQLEERRAKIEQSIARAEGEISPNTGGEYDPVVAEHNNMLREDLDRLRGDLAQVERELSDLPRKAEAAGVPRSWVE